MDLLDQLWNGSGLAQMTFGQFAMILISLLLLYLAIAKKFEPLLLVTIGFGYCNIVFKFTGHGFKDIMHDTQCAIAIID